MIKRRSSQADFVIQISIQTENGILKTQYLEEIGVTGSGKPTGFSTTPKIQEAALFDTTNFAFIQLILEHILAPSMKTRDYISVRVVRLCAVSKA